MTQINHYYGKENNQKEKTHTAGSAQKNAT